MRLRKRMQLKNIPLDLIEEPNVPLDNEDVKPGLFLTSNQVERLLEGKSILVQWQDRMVILLATVRSN